MKQIVTISVLVFMSVAIACSGCETVRLPTGKGYTDLCQGYVGLDAQRLINAWGHPGRTFDAADQKKVLVYVETWDERTMNPLAHSALIEYPPRVDPRAGAMGETSGGVTGQSVSSMNYCITYFEVDKANKIGRVFWKGDCKAVEKTDTPPQ